MLDNTKYMLKAAVYYFKNVRRLSQPKGLVQNVKYYLSAPVVFVAFMVSAYNTMGVYNRMRKMNKDMNK